MIFTVKFDDPRSEEAMVASMNNSGNSLYGSRINLLLRVLTMIWSRLIAGSFSVCTG